MSAKENSGRKYRTISELVLWAAGIFFFLVVVFVFRFEKNEEVYATPPAGQRGPRIVRLSHAGQAFRLSQAVGRFDKITVILQNPLRQDISCRFTLRSRKNGRVLDQRQFVLKRGTSRDNPKEISVRPVRLDRSRDFYFELDSRLMFDVATLPGNPSEDFAADLDGRTSDGRLFFRVTNTEKTSLLAWASGPGAGEARTAAILLGLLSFGLWLLACRFFMRMKLSWPRLGVTVASGGRTQALILSLVALSLFCLIGVTVLAGANVHTRLLGAEDDAYISYRYARNIAEGNGFRFNLDEKILGTTTPLYTLILALPTVFGGRTHVISLFLNLASILGSGLVLNRLLSRRLTPRAGLAGGLVFVFFPMFYRILGMETNFFIFLLLSGLLLLDGGKSRWAAFVLGLAVLTRMEAVLLWPLTCLFLLSRKEYREIWKFSGVFLLTLAPWFAFSLWYFGKLVPNTFHIKTIFTVSEEPVRKIIHALSTFSLKKSEWLKGFGTYLPDFIQHYAAWAGLFLISLAIAARDIWRTAVLRLFLFWTVLYIAVYAVLGAWLFVWYYVVALAIIPLVLAMALVKISEKLKNRWGRPVSAAVAVLLLSGLILFEAGDVFNFLTGQWYSSHTGHVERYGTYMDIAGFIRENVPADKSVGMEEIGILGYFITNKVWDFYSLVHDPQTYRVMMPGENLPFLLTLMDPDYLVLNSDRLPSRVAFQNYEEVQVFPVQEYPWSPFFFYSLLRKKSGSLIPCGDVYAENRLSGTGRISGWVVGSEAILSVEVMEDGRMIAGTDVLHEPPDEIRRYIGRNPNAQKAGFHIGLDSKRLPNGVHDLEFWARSESKSGIFFRKTVTIVN